MKNIIKTRCLNLLLGILILAGCSNPALEQIETSARTGTGAVSVRIGTVEGQFEDVARTLAPVAPPEFLRYTLTFSGPEEHEAVDITFGTSASLELAVGEWTITATAYTDETAVAQGSVTVTVHTGSNTPANIILTPVSGGTGTFSYSIDAPTGVTGTLVVVTAEGVAVSGSPFTLTEGPNVDNLSLSSGQYLMSVRLTLDGKAAGRTEAVHIYSDMTTSVEYRFTGHDFSEIVNLVAGEWQDGTISSGDELYYRFTAATETDYTITWDDYYGTKNDYPYVVLRVDAYWEADNTSIFTYGYGYEAPKTFNTGSNSGNIIVRVEYDGGYDSGPYAIKYYDSTSLPPQGSMTISSVVATPVPACVISWNYVNGVTGYRLYRSTNLDSGYTEIADITGYYTSYTDTGVSAGTTYYYKVAAYNANGEGELSSAMSGTPPDSSAIIALTDGEWLHDEIATSGDIKWYSFIASEGTSYQVQWNARFYGDGTKTLYANVSAFQADGSYIFHEIDSGWTSPETFSGVSGTVYLLVQGWSLGDTGTYAIKYAQE
ncbi:MAG: fibronectin type III domain-containing protein [Treponema sp.]|jgi:hypothetical protein|nr:fibronectin type III domain-containing protein [Treponema sp.]